MKLNEFVNLVMKLSEDDNVEDKEIESLVQAFYKSLPLQSAVLNNLFVVRSSMNGEGEILQTRHIALTLLTGLFKK